MKDKITNYKIALLPYYLTAYCLSSFLRITSCTPVVIMRIPVGRISNLTKIIPYGKIDQNVLKPGKK